MKKNQKKQIMAVGINSRHLRKLIIRPTLIEFNLWSEVAENLIMGTGAQETHLGHFLKQNLNGVDGTGRALGIYQMEPQTHMDIWLNFITYKKELARKMCSTFSYNGIHPAATDMIFNLKYATIMCRLHYLRVKTPLPDANNLPELAYYWKKHYNTEKGKGTVAEFISNYEKYV